jgi:hypothetical protein
MPFQATGYVPQYGDRIAELMMRQGEIAARGAERSGMIWGRAIENLGQIAGNAVEQHQQQKIAKQKDEGIYSVMQSWDGQDPTALVKGLATYIGPVEAVKVAGGLQKLMEAKQGAPLDASHVAGPVGALAALERSSPGHLQRNWGLIYPQIESLAKQAGLPVAPEWSEDMTKGVMTLDQQFNPSKAPAAPPFTTVDGQGFERGAQGWAPAPGLPAAPPKPQTRQAVLDTQTGRPVLATGAEIEANPTRYEPMRTGVNVNMPKPEAKAVAPDDFTPEDLALFPRTWLDVDEGTKTREDYSVRASKDNPQGARVTASDAATRAGRVLPSKKEKEAVLAGQEAVAKAKRIAGLLDTPIDPGKPTGTKVSDFFGPWGKSYMAEWQSAGYGKKLPQPVIEARAAIAKFSAKDRNELFGAALTKIESQFAVQFEPDLSAPPETIKAQLNAYATGIAKGFESTWGPNRLTPPKSELPPEDQAAIDALFGARK